MAPKLTDSLRGSNTHQGRCCSVNNRATRCAIQSVRLVRSPQLQQQHHGQGRARPRVRPRPWVRCARARGAGPRDARDLGHGPGFGPFGLLCEMICLCGLCAMCFREPPPPPPPRQPQPVYGAAPAPEASPARARVRERRAAPRRSGPAAPARRRAAGRPAARLRAARRVAAAALRLSARPALRASYIAAAPEARRASVLGASSPRTCGASRRRAAEASRCLRPVSARLRRARAYGVEYAS